jgi:hypothetical protein
MSPFSLSAKKYSPVLLVSFLLLVTPQVASADAATVLYSVVVGFFGMFVYAGGNILDFAITNYVVGFGAAFNGDSYGVAVNALWTNVRDIFNLTFIFGLIYIGFKMIFDSGDSSAKKMLVSLILAALLVNFSLLITKLVIDFSNIAATQFVQSFPSSGEGDNAVFKISESFMNTMGITGVFSNSVNLAELQMGAQFGFIFGTMIVLIIAAFVFLAGGLMLIVRFIALIIYMILSPVMFLGWVFPGLKSVSRKYWNGFLGKAFFAPAFILMLYFANQVLVQTKNSFPTTNENLATVLSEGAKEPKTFGSTLLFFIVASGFLVAALVVGQKLGAEGANTAVALGKRGATKARQLTQRGAKGAMNATTYLPRAGVRMGVNAAGTRLEKKLNNLQTQQGRLGRLARTNVVDRAARGTTQNMQNAQIGTGTTNKAEKDYKDKTQARAIETEAKNDRDKKVNQHDQDTKDPGKSTVELEKALKDLAKVMKDMSKDEKLDKIAALAAQNGGKVDQKFAVNLTDADIDHFEKSGRFSPQEINNMRTARNDGFKAMAEHGSTLVVGGVPTVPGAVGADTRNILTGRSVSEIGKFPVDVFKQPAMYKHLTPSMIEERMKNGIDEIDRIDMLMALGVVPGNPPSSVPSLVGTVWDKWETKGGNWAIEFFKAP